MERPPVELLVEDHHVEEGDAVPDEGAAEAEKACSSSSLTR
jgi:hypothetical protein